MPLDENNSIEGNRAGGADVHLPDEEPTLEELDRILDQIHKPLLDACAARHKEAQNYYAEDVPLKQYGVMD